MIKKILLFYLFLLITSTISATRYHVTTSATLNARNGLTWNTAFTRLQQALDLAVKGDTVWVAAGKYLPERKYADVDKDGTPTTDRDRSFIIQDSVVVMGGFPEMPTDDTGLSSRDWIKNQTVLSGDFNDDDDSNFGNISDNACHVVVLIGATPELVLDGFIIQGGNSNAPQTAYYNGDRKNPIIFGCGGGIYCSSNDKEQSPTLRNLHIHSNYAAYEGGGLYIVSEELEASPEISNVTFMNNKAISYDKDGRGGHGGGLLIEGRHNEARLTNVIITGNSALSDGSSNGGGAYFRAIEDCKPTLQNTLIAGNTSKGGGGAYFNSRTMNTEPVLTNVTVSANRTKPIAETNSDSDLDGGGLMVSATLGDATPVIRNTAICDNLGSVPSRNEIFIVSAAGKLFDLIYLNSFVKGIDLAVPSLPGNTDPMFLAPADAQYTPTGNQWFDYVPKLGSPLINKGNNSVVTSTKDLSGNTRIYSGIVDIGAYESQGIDPPQFNENIESKLIWSYQNRLFVRINSSATLKIYSINGMLIKQINNLSIGTHKFSLTQGIYIVELNDKKEKLIIR